MNIAVRRFLLVLTGLVTFGVVGFFVLREETLKRQSKISSLQATYASEYKALEDYKKQLEQVKQANLKKMQEVKTTYESLLASQPAAIKAQTPTGSTASTTTTTIKVAKPKASTKTATS